jgi:polyhydroxybutyrate depolymerase
MSQVPSAGAMGQPSAPVVPNNSVGAAGALPSSTTSAPASAGVPLGGMAAPQLGAAGVSSGGTGGSVALAGTGSQDSAGSTGGAMSNSASEPPVGCPAQPDEVGEHMYTLKSANGMTYTYYLLIPKGIDVHKKNPVIFKWHAYTSSPEEFRKLEKVDEVAEKTGTIMVYPKSPDGSWDVGSCCDFTGIKRNEETFVRELVKEITTNKVCADEHRIYTTGLSNGAMLSQMLACKMSDVFAAAATVVGTLTIPQAQCTPKRPMPIFMINGTADPLVGYNLPGAAGGLSVPDDYKFWAQKNMCTGEPEMTLQKGKVTCKTYKNCAAEVAYCVAEGMGHCMPGMVEESPTNCLTRGAPLGPPNDDIDGVQMSSDFLLRFSMP